MNLDSRLVCKCGREQKLSVFMAKIGFVQDNSASKLQLLASEINELLPRLRCANCNQRGAISIYEDNFSQTSSTKLQEQPSAEDNDEPDDSPVFCIECDEPIPPKRLQASPGTTLCVECASFNENQKNLGTQFPNVPVGLQGKCPQCKSGVAVVYQNHTDKNFFVGCSAFPKCRWAVNIE